MFRVCWMVLQADVLFGTPKTGSFNGQFNAGQGNVYNIRMIGMKCDTGVHKQNYFFPHNSTKWKCYKYLLFPVY